MKRDKYKLIVDLLMCAVIFFIVVAGLVKTIFFARDINDYENRKANKIQKFSLENFYNSNFQNSMESALADQIVFSTTMKKNYNKISHKFIQVFYDCFDDNLLKGKYINMNGIYKIGGTDNLVYLPYLFDTYNKCDKKISSLKGLIEKYPNLDFYVYYIEKDTDINLETGEKLGLSDYIVNKLNESNLKTGIFRVNSMDDFKENFYKTDHHWNYKGSYRGYTEILSMMLTNETPLSVVGLIKTNTRLTGSKAYTSGTTDMFSEEFVANLFDIPEHTTIINGKNMEYGREEEYSNNLDLPITYGDFYGWDYGEVEFDFNNPNRENVLIIGESYDNAIIKLIASHFNKTYAVDLRNYENEIGKKFIFDSYVQEKSIDKVLFIGNIDYYLMDTFLVEE